MAYTTINKSSDYFRIKLWTGNGVDDRNITFDETSNMQPDFTWIKSRSGTNWNTLFDSVRGVGNRIYSNEADAQDNNADSLQAFQTNGFQVGTNGSVNGNTNQLVAWNWKAGTTTGGTLGGAGITPSAYSFNSTAGFSILKYTGDGSNSSLPHFLGAIPDMITVKNLTDSSTNWRSIFPNIAVGGASNGADYNLNLNTSNAWNNGTEFRDIMPDANIFRVSSADDVNKSGSQYIAYCFKNITGYSKIGHYVGNGADKQFIYLGFKPAYFLWKNTDQSDHWGIIDNKRDTFNDTYGHELQLRPHQNSADLDGTGDRGIDFLSNGVCLRGWASANGTVSANESGLNYIFMAFAQAPLVGSNNVPCTAK